MIPLYTPIHLDIKEFVCPVVYNARGSLAWHLFDPQLLRDADMLRKRYGPMFINTWSLSAEIQAAYGIRTESGLRIPSHDNYKPYSQHTFGRAFDALFRDVSAEEIREDVINERFLATMEPIILETGISWLHWAVGNYRTDQTSGIITVV